MKKKKTKTNTNTKATQPPVERVAYSMAECAEALGLSYFTVHRLVKRGLLRSSNALRHKLIPRTELERFLAETLGDRRAA